MFNRMLQYDWQSKSPRNSSTPTVWCTMSSYRLDRELLVISTCKICRSCAIQVGGSGATSGTDSEWFLHRDNAPSHTSLVVQQFLTEKNIPVITQPPYSSDRALSDIWLFLLQECASRGHASQPLRNWMRRPNFGRVQMKPSAGAFNNGRIDGASVYVSKDHTMKVNR
jgi:hypothetical protein